MTLRLACAACLIALLVVQLVRPVAMVPAPMQKPLSARFIDPVANAPFVRGRRDRNALITAMVQPGRRRDPMHFQGAGFAQAVLFHEHPEVVVCGKDTVRRETKRVRSGLDGRPPMAVHEGYGQVIPVSVSKITKMEGSVRPHVNIVGIRVSVDAEIVYGGSGERVFDQCERCLRPMPVWYPEVDYHADEGNECSHPCRRGPREASHPMHNSIFPQKNNAAGTSCGGDKELRYCNVN